mgnify:FL=1
MGRETNKNNVSRMLQDNEMLNKEKPMDQSEPLPIKEQEET